MSQAGLPVIDSFYMDGEERVFPVVAYMDEGSNVFPADNGAYAVFDLWSAALYMRDFDDSLVESVSAALQDGGVTASRQAPSYDRDEQLWRQQWTFSLKH